MRPTTSEDDLSWDQRKPSTAPHPPARHAIHRPATRRRRYRHDDLIAVDLFSGFGGLTEGIKRAGFTTIMAANHNTYKIEIHEANHPEAEHWIADLINPDSADYHSARDLPAADLLVAGVSCVNHSPANTQKAYQLGLNLFDLDDPDYEARVTRSERDRATANCVLHYAERHHPRMILVECTTELQSWGSLVPGSKKIGDGSTYRWWLRQFDLLGYSHKVLFLNSMFFGVGQSRDRAYWVFWDRSLTAPDLEHRPESWCPSCDEILPAIWSWKTGVPPTGAVRYDKQYNYRCPRCHREVVPPFTPSLDALDLSDLGTRIGDRKRPLAPATMARAERCRQRFADFPAVLMPAKAAHGTERHPGQPMATQTSQQEVGILSTGAVIAAAGNTFERPGSTCRTRTFDQPLPAQTATNSGGLLMAGSVIAAHRHNGDGQPITRAMDTITTTHEKAVLLAVDNFQGAPRSASEALPVQGGSETMALVSSGVVPFRKHTIPTTHGEAMPTITSEQIPGLLTAAGTIKNNGSIDEAGYRSHGLGDPLGTVVGSAITQSLLSAGWFKQNGSTGTETMPHPVTDALGTMTSRDTTGILAAQWEQMLSEITLEDCYFRMMFDHEIGRGCGFDVDFPSRGHQGTFIVWGKTRDRVDGYGNAVSPQVGHWIGNRLRAVLHHDVAA